MAWVRGNTDRSKWGSGEINLRGKREKGLVGVRRSPAAREGSQQSRIGNSTDVRSPLAAEGKEGGLGSYLVSRNPSCSCRIDQIESNPLRSTIFLTESLTTSEFYIEAPPCAISRKLMHEILELIQKT